MKAIVFLTGQVLLTSMAFSEIFGNLLLEHIYFRGVSERVGSIILSVGGDDFQGVSLENPVYLRISFDHGAVLRETLVDLEGTGSMKTPIFLRTELRTMDSETTINMPPEAIAIVRWLAGENAFWIRITSDSASWVRKGEDLFEPPSVDQRISFTIGLNLARMALRPAVPPEKVNRANNARLDGAPVSTEIRLDISQSDLETSGIGSVLNFNPEFFDAQTTGVSEAAEINIGEELPILYTGCTSIGRGRDRLGGTSFLFPWISNNDRFESLLIANNYGPYPSKVSFTARRADGTEQRVETMIPAWGVFKANASELFGVLGPGDGYSVEMLATEHETVHGRWITFNRSRESGASPSQGNAVPWNIDTNAPNELLGKSIQFGYLPPTGDFFAAPVILNVGQENADVVLYIFNLEGELLLINDQAVRALEPMRPFAILVSDLVPGNEEELNIIAVSQSETSLLTGASFVFNSFGEPSIGNAQGIRFFPLLLNPKK